MIRISKIFLCALLQFALCVVGDAQMRSLPPIFKDWIKSDGMKHATVSMEIVRLPRTAPQQTPDSLNPAINRGRVLYSYDPERLMTPASVLKLVTAATGFRVLGPNYVWPDSVPMIDSADVRLPGLERFNPDLLVEDIEEYMPGLDNLLPDSGQMLMDVMDRTLAESLNLQAETLLRLLTPSCRLDSGLLKVQDYWRKRGLDMESLVMYDGCGISPSDRVTAHFINSLLADMQFDAQRGRYGSSNATLMENIAYKWQRAGYQMPELVYWNVQARGNNVIPMQAKDGITFVSGFSPVLFEQIMKGKTGYDLMMDKLNSERYECIR